MGMIHKLASSWLASFGGLSLVGTVWMGAYFTQERVDCTTSQPTTCNTYVDAPEEELLRKRDDNYVAHYRDTSDVSSSALADFRPEWAYTYEPCSANTGTGLMVAGTPVTNQWCLHLGCNYKQCVQKAMKCNRDTGSHTGAPHDSFLINGVATPEIFCVAAKLHSDMDPGKFVALLLAILISLGMCAAGAASARDFSPVRPMEQMQVKAVVPQEQP